MNAPPAPTSLTIIIPCRNEAEGLPFLQQSLQQVIEQLETIQTTIIYIDDGSTDNTWSRIQTLSNQDERVMGLCLSRNFGQQIAITAGLDRADSDMVVIMDADLQDPPQVIPEMITKWEQGFKVVHAVRRSRKGETHFKRISAALFHRLCNLISDIAIPVDTGDFRLLDRSVVDVINKMRERHRFLQGMAAWTGFSQTEVGYERASRHTGKSNYSLRKMLNYALDALLSFSTIPVRVFSLFGLGSCLIGILGGILALSFSAKGTVLLFFSALVFGGIQLLFLGVIGEYICKIYIEVKHRPLYVISEQTGIDPAITISSVQP